MSEWDAVAATVILPGSPGYEQARKPAMARFHDARPRAIVRAASAGDVVETIALAQRNGWRTTPRSGGHCFAGRSSAGDVIIDVSLTNTVKVEGDVVTVGAGVRLAELYDALAGHGRTIPAGCGTTVGIAGLALGGGLGMLGRRYGLTCDQLLAAQVVLADGRVVDCDNEREPDLFWALRGSGGGHFGVVTSLTLRTVPAPVTTVFDLEWPAARVATLIETWQEWAPAAPDEVTADLKVTGQLTAHVVGIADDPAVLDDLVRAVGAPVADFRQEMPYREVKRHLAGPGGEAADDAVMASKSEFFRRTLPRETIAALLDHLAGPGHELNFTVLAGAYNRVPAQATAYVHRDETFLVEHVATTPPAELAAATGWAARGRQLAHPYGSGRVYPNFPDPDLENWQDAYYGDNYARLVEVKRAYDPDNWFRFPQSIG